MFCEPLYRTLVFGKDYSAPALEEILYTALLTVTTTGILEGGNIASYSDNDIKALVEQSKEQIKEDGEKDLQSGEMPDDAHLEIMELNPPTARGMMAIYQMVNMEQVLGETLRANSEQESNTLDSEKNTVNSSVEHLGHIDYSDREAVIRRLEQEENRTVSFDYEVNCTVTNDGEVWIVSGDAVSVDPTQIPRDLKGSCSYHNHPSDKTWYSFSAEDAAFFIESGQEYSKASDNIFEYIMQRRADTIVASYEEVYKRFREIRRTEVMEMMWDGIIDREFDEYHEIMKILSREYKFDYERRERNGGK